MAVLAAASEWNKCCWNKCCCVSPMSVRRCSHDDILLLLSCRDSVDGHLVTPATVSEVINMGWTVKHVLKFDDDVEVRTGASHTYITLLAAM